MGGASHLPLNFQGDLRMIIEIKVTREKGRLKRINLTPLGDGELEGLQILSPSEALKEFITSYLNCIWHPPYDLLKEAQEEISQSLPWALPIYKQLLEVKLGERITYKKLGEKLKMHPRKIGVAMRLNPFPLIIPCHRVVGTKELGGYSQGSKIKKALLNFEERCLRKLSLEGIDNLT